jgi:hypothetical protein
VPVIVRWLGILLMALAAAALFHGLFYLGWTYLRGWL